jgi:precorrin-6A/cobalt-precorrin-6A reductase
MRQILILGGTAEARRLAGLLAKRADLKVTLSLAGRTAQPAAQPVPVRIGGFGGTEGLIRYLNSERVDALIDATHPFAATISRHAAEGCAAARVPILAVRRAAWTAVPGDNWIETGDMAGAVRALGASPRRVFLTVGRNEVAAFEAAPQHHYLVRSVDPVDPPLNVPDAHYVVARGPFTETDEKMLLGEHRIETIVAKNSGGEATYAKIAAARALGVTVVVLRPPALPDVPAVETIAEAASWLDHVPPSGTNRGV